MTALRFVTWYVRGIGSKAKKTTGDSPYQGQQQQKLNFKDKSAAWLWLGLQALRITLSCTRSFCCPCLRSWKLLCRGYVRETDCCFESNWSAASSGHLDDSMGTYWLFLLLLFCVGVHGCRRLPLGGILSIRKTPNWLHGLESVTRAYIDPGVRSRRVTF